MNGGRRVLRRARTRWCTQICEILNPTNCDTATVTVTVGAALIDAVDDSFGPIVGAVGGTTPTVLTNDTLGGNPVTVGVGGNVTLTPGAAPTPAAGSITMNPDGTITIARARRRARICTRTRSAKC